MAITPLATCFHAGSLRAPSSKCPIFSFTSSPALKYRRLPTLPSRLLLALGGLGWRTPGEGRLFKGIFFTRSSTLQIDQWSTRETDGRKGGQRAARHTTFFFLAISPQHCFSFVCARCGRTVVCCCCCNGIRGMGQVENEKVSLHHRCCWLLPPTL